MIRLKLMLFVGVMLYVLPFSAQAELSPEQVRGIEEAEIQRLASTQGKPVTGKKSALFAHLAKRDVMADWGGWLSTYLFKVKDSDNSAKTLDSVKSLRITDVRLWFRAEKLHSRFSTYIRLRSTRTDRKVTSSYVGAPDDVQSLFLDMGYIETKLKKNSGILRLGRQYLKVGRGIVYSGVDDGVSLDRELGKGEITVFVSRTEAHPRTQHSDENFPSMRARRSFAGAEYTYRGRADVRATAFYLYEKDRSRENPENQFQDFRYDANFLGFGIDADVLKNGKVWMEYIVEGGRSSPDTAPGKMEKISASAFVAGVQKFTDWRQYPVSIFAEYMRGSGDDDRGRITSAEKGNTKGTTDQAFNYFGYYNTGYAFAPIISNLNIYKAGFSISPRPLPHQVTVSVTGYLYRKIKPNGAISSPQAIRTSKDVGSEIDGSLSWRLASDLTFQFQGGRFKPANAFPSQLGERIFYTNANLTLEF